MKEIIVARRQRHRTERTRRALLSAASELFRERGYADTTVAEITERAGRAHGTFYLYFDNKHDIFSALLAGMGTVITDYAREHWEAESLIDSVWLGVRHFFIVAEENADLWRLLEQMAAVDERAADLRAQLRETIASKIRRGIELSRTSETEHLDAGLIAHLLTAIVFRFARMGKLPGGPDLLAMHVTVLWARALGYPETEIVALEDEVLATHVDSTAASGI